SVYWISFDRRGATLPLMTTDRVILRRWRESDREPFARLNADARVMEFMPDILSEQESNLLADRIEAHFPNSTVSAYIRRSFARTGTLLDSLVSACHVQARGYYGR